MEEENQQAAALQQHFNQTDILSYTHVCFRTPAGLCAADSVLQLWAGLKSEFEKESDAQKDLWYAKYESAILGRNTTAGGTTHLYPLTQATPDPAFLFPGKHNKRSALFMYYVLSAGSRLMETSEKNTRTAV